MSHPGAMVRFLGGGGEGIVFFTKMRGETVKGEMEKKIIITDDSPGRSNLKRAPRRNRI